MDTTFHVDKRSVFEGIPPMPWIRSPVGWNTLSAACHSMEHMINTEARRQAVEGRGFKTEFQVVKVTTVVVCKDDENISYIRAGGDCICEACGKKYYDHDMAEEIIGYNDKPWLHRLCDGRLVKL